MKYVIYFMKRLYAYTGNILYVNLIGMVIISLLEGIGIFLLIPLIHVSGIFSLDIKAIPILGIFSFLQSLPATLGLPIILGIYILIVVCQNLLQRNLAIRNVEIIYSFSRQLRIETYRLLLQANWNYFVKRRNSELITNMTVELARVISGMNLFLLLVASLIFTLFQIGLALWLSVKMTLFVLLCGLILVLFAKSFINKARTIGNQTSELAQSYLAGITDQLNGIKDIKSNTLEQSRLKWLGSVTNGMLQEQIAYVKLRTSSQILYKISSALLIAVFIYFSVGLFQAHPEQLIVMIIIFSRLWPKFSDIQSNLQQISSTIPAFKSLIDLRNECQEAKEILDGSHNDHSEEPLRIIRDIQCRDLFFRYDNDKESAYALQDINIQIPSNRMTAIVGRSGAGKSTLIDILMGMLQPVHGQVLIDGTPLTMDNLLSLRQAISYVSQDPFLFNGSIKENLMMIKPEASEAEIWEALEFSSAVEFVRKLPHGLDTLIGDRGIKLSGGERQRLVLARAILKKPSILVLDEATSALDTENELRIQEALERIKGSVTIIVIAHRLSTIRNADQVIVLDEGKVIQIGAYRQLANEKRGMFKSLLRNQEASLL